MDPEDSSHEAGSAFTQSNPSSKSSDLRPSAFDLAAQEEIDRGHDYAQLLELVLEAEIHLEDLLRQVADLKKNPLLDEKKILADDDRELSSEAEVRGLADKIRLELGRQRTLENAVSEAEGLVKIKQETILFVEKHEKRQLALPSLVEKKNALEAREKILLSELALAAQAAKKRASKRLTAASIDTTENSFSESASDSSGRENAFNRKSSRENTFGSHAMQQLVRKMQRDEERLGAELDSATFEVRGVNAYCIQKDRALRELKELERERDESIELYSGVAMNSLNLKAVSLKKSVQDTNAREAKLRKENLDSENMRWDAGGSLEAELKAHKAEDTSDGVRIVVEQTEARNDALAEEVGRLWEELVDNVRLAGVTLWDVMPFESHNEDKTVHPIAHFRGSDFTTTGSSSSNNFEILGAVLEKLQMDEAQARERALELDASGCATLEKELLQGLESISSLLDAMRIERGERPEGLSPLAVDTKEDPFFSLSEAVGEDLERELGVAVNRGQEYFATAIERVEASAFLRRKDTLPRKSSSLQQMKDSFSGASAMKVALETLRSNKRYLIMAVKKQIQQDRDLLLSLSGLASDRSNQASAAVRVLLQRRAATKLQVLTEFRLEKGLSGKKGFQMDQLTAYVHHRASNNKSTLDHTDAEIAAVAALDPEISKTKLKLERKRKELFKATGASLDLEKKVEDAKAHLVMCSKELDTRKADLRGLFGVTDVDCNTKLIGSPSQQVEGIVVGKFVPSPSDRSRELVLPRGHRRSMVNEELVVSETWRKALTRVRSVVAISSAHKGVKNLESSNRESAAEADAICSEDDERVSGERFSGSSPERGPMDSFFADEPEDGSLEEAVRLLLEADQEARFSGAPHVSLSTISELLAARSKRGADVNVDTKDLLFRLHRLKAFTHRHRSPSRSKKGSRKSASDERATQLVKFGPYGGEISKESVSREFPSFVTGPDVLQVLFREASCADEQRVVCEEELQRLANLEGHARVCLSVLQQGEPGPAQEAGMMNLNVPEGATLASEEKAMMSFLVGNLSKSSDETLFAAADLAVQLAFSERLRESNNNLQRILRGLRDFFETSQQDLQRILSGSEGRGLRTPVEFFAVVGQHRMQPGTAVRVLREIKKQEESLQKICEAVLSIFTALSEATKKTNSKSFELPLSAGEEADVLSRLSTLVLPHELVERTTVLLHKELDAATRNQRAVAVSLADAKGTRDGLSEEAEYLQLIASKGS